MDFRKLSPKERSKFLTNKHKDETMIKAVGMDDNWDLLEDKIIFYQYFHHFFHREVFIPGKGKEKDFDNFCARHNCLIVKKKDGQCGKGVYKINSSELSESHKCELATCDDNIIEEVIRQSGKMASLNESSVNTVRIPSFSTKGNYSILKPFLRMGRSGSIVDNGNSGGIFATIDPKTGIINGHGHDLRGNEYISHPDSGVVLKGWQIPDWDDLLKLTKDVHQIIPFYPYVGWDFAHTDKGWCLIEGNWGQFLSEFADKEGIKSKFDSYFQNI